MVIDNLPCVDYNKKMADRDNNANGGRNKDNKSGSGFTLALWVVAALILFIMFVVNQGKIISNLKQTGFFSRMFGKTPSFIENAPDVVREKNDVEPVTTTGNANEEINLITSANSQISSLLGQAGENAQSNSYEENAANNEESDSTPATVTDAEAANAAANLGRQMNLRLYFMSINSNGSVARKEITRAMPKSSSPLVDAVNALITGPTPEEEAEGCRTLISTGTQLLSASLSKGTATLSFSSDFEFNQFGIEGTRGQLQQIVYTATAFPTVDNVQFLIEGEKREYLGSEGVWIGTPLSRESF